MTRRIAALVAIFVAGCATTSLEERVARLERENAELRKPTVRVAAVRHPASIRQPPFIATNYRPPTCGGGLCMEIENREPHNVVAMTINGEAVLMQGGVLPPQSSAFVRLPTPGRYVFEAVMHDRISVPGGRSVPHAVVRENCRVVYPVGGVGNHAPRLTFSNLTCWSPVGKL